VERNSPLGQPGADLPPGLGLPSLPGIHALLRYYELRELVSRYRLDQTREIGAGASELEQESFRREAQRGRRGSGQATVVRDATACGRRCVRAGVNDVRSLSWLREAVNPHLVLIE
jgi:hypothetical protein